MSTNDYQIITAAEAAADPTGVEVRSGARPYAPVSFVKLSKDGDFITFTYTGGGTFTIPTSHKPAFRRALVAVRPKADAHCPNGCEGIRPDGSHIHTGDADALLLDFHTFDKSDPWARPKRYDEPKRIVAQPAGRDRFGNPLAARVYLLDRQPELRDDGKARIFAENRTVKAPSGGYYFTPVVVLADSIIKAHPHHPAGCRCLSHELAETLS